jgi:H+/gluconate symporter-like permease
MIVDFGLCKKLSGLTEKEMLKTWSVLLTLISLVGVVLSLAGATLLPLR